jgi:mannose-6-phosphate isomerase-like protein (cupin superfamily)
MNKVNLGEKLKLLKEAWSPRIIAAMNDVHFKLAKLEGEFVWHSHEDTDEVFLCLEGEVEIQMRSASVLLKKGEMFVVPKGVEHRPVAEKPCYVMLIEPAGVVNTGEVESRLTAPNDVWL